MLSTCRGCAPCGYADIANSTDQNDVDKIATLVLSPPPIPSHSLDSAMQAGGCSRHLWDSSRHRLALPETLAEPAAVP